MTKPFEFAPYAILRAANWPIETISDFGDCELAQLAKIVKGENPKQWEEYIKFYEKVLHEEREKLWLLTEDSPRFMKALLLSNPDLVRQIRYLSQFRRGHRTKGLRHLENALYRYLARSVGRTTPHGLWAGVTGVNFGQKFEIVSTSPHYLFTPDLRPFQSLLRTLAKRSPYQEKSYWRINPTLNRQDNGSWYFWVNTAAGKREYKEIKGQTWLDSLFSSLLNWEGGSLDELTIYVTAWYRKIIPQSSQPETEILEKLLMPLIKGGLFWGGLDLPLQFTTPWEALETVSEQLESKDSHVWQQTIRALHSLCSELERSLDNLSLEDLENYLHQARQSVRELAVSLNISSLTIPHPVLRCDLGLPFQITLDSQQRERLIDTLIIYETVWLEEISPAKVFRQEQRDNWKKLFAGEISLSQAVSPLSNHFAGEFALFLWSDLGLERSPEFKQKLKKWQNLLLTGTEVVRDLNPIKKMGHGELSNKMENAPFGCLYVQIFEDFQLLAQGISDNPTASFARFSFLLKEHNKLQNWLTDCLSHLQKKYHLLVVECQSPFEINPNVLARGESGIVPLSLWGASQKTPSLVGVKLCLDPVNQLPCLKFPKFPEPVIVFWFASGNIALIEPLAKPILQTTFSDSLSHNFRASAVPVLGELETPQFTPRIRLAQKVYLRPRRTILSGTVLQNLVRASPCERYAQWQQLAVQQKWPALVFLQRDQDPPLLMNRDSPLALEALFKGVNLETRWLIVEELMAMPWLQDTRGQHYLTELAWSFSQ